MPPSQVKLIIFKSNPKAFKSKPDSVDKNNCK